MPERWVCAHLFTLARAGFVQADRWVSFHPAKKIVLVIATLGAGGAERVMTLLAGEWVRRGNEVTLMTLGDAAHDHYQVAPGVKRVGLDALGASSGKLDAVRRNVTRIRQLRQAIRAERPDAVISFMDSTNVLTLLATRGLPVPVVVSERIDPRYYPVAAGWTKLRRLLYPRATAVVVQTERVAQWAREFLSEDRVKVIANPVEVRADDPAAPVPDWLPERPFILAMGRLDRQKGFDLLITAYQKLQAWHGVAPLVILGEGPERGELEKQARAYSLDNDIVFPGRVGDPGTVLSRAKMFVLSSRFEGFPNALLEAMATGLPVVSFNCPSGPGDIIVHETNGLLVEMSASGNDEEHAERLAAAMRRLLEDEELRVRLGGAARSVTESFSLAKVTDSWEQLLSHSTSLTAGTKPGKED